MNRITEVVEKEVNFLEDVDVEWISIVDHGANRAPFKVIKSENNDERSTQMYDVIQSIVVSAGEDIEDIKKKCDWLNGINLIKVDSFDSYSKHTQFPIERFDQESLRLTKIPETDTIIITGTLLEEDVNAVALGRDTRIKSVGYSESFCDMAFNELYAMIQSIQGTLELSELTNDKKKSAIANSLDAFRTFISAGLDNASDSVVMKVDILKNEREATMDQVEKTVETNEVVDKEIEREFNVEEAVAKLSERLDSVVEKFATDSNMNAAIPGPNDTNQVPQVPGGTDESSMFGANTSAGAVIAALSKLSELVEKLSERLDKMDSVVTESAAASEPVESVKKVDDSDPFRGLIFK